MLSKSYFARTLTAISAGEANILVSDAVCPDGHRITYTHITAYDDTSDFVHLVMLAGPLGAEQEFDYTQNPLETERMTWLGQPVVCAEREHIVFDFEGTTDGDLLYVLLRGVDEVL
jgi:hypothetical protein